MLRELAPGIFWMAPAQATDRPALVAVAGDAATLVVDAGASVRHARCFQEALASTGAPAPRYVVLTHAHWDHVFGAGAYGPETRLVATAATARDLATMAGWAWDDDALDRRVERGVEIPFCRDMIKAELSAADRAELTVRQPDETFVSTWSCDLGGRTVEALHVGGDHAADSCVVVVPGVAAFLGDCVYPNIHVTPNVYTRARLLPLLDRLVALDVGCYVLGHDDAPLDRAAFVALAGMLRAAADAVAQHEDDDAALATLERQGIGVTEDVRDAVAALRAGQRRG